MPAPLDPATLGMTSGVLALASGLLGERVMRWIPVFPYQGEHRVAFLAVVAFFASLAVAMTHWVNGTLAINHLADLGWAFVAAAGAVGAVWALYQGKSPAQLARAEAQGLALLSPAWRDTDKP